MKRTVRYGASEINFEILRVPRKTLEIAVHPNREVIVKAPMETDLQKICICVIKRARWIFKQIAYFKQFEPRTPTRHYVGGETHLYLGRKYRLKILGEEDESVRIVGGRIIVSIDGSPAPERVKRLLYKWYRQKAKQKFQERLEYCLAGFHKKNFISPNLRIRTMSTRWGSLSSNDNLTLNLQLIKAPRDCIDYVVTHELCHVTYKNHGPEFYKLLEKTMPDWERRKHKLELALV